MQMQPKVPCCAVFNWSFDFVSWSFKEIDHASFTSNCPLKSWISFAIHIGSPVGSACEPIHTYCMNPSRSWNPIAAMLSACMARNKVFVTTHNVVKILSYLHSASRRQPWQWSRWRRRRKNRAQDNAFWTSSGQIKRRLPTKRRRIQESWRIWRKQRRRRRSGIRSNVIDISEKQHARSSTSEAMSSISILVVSWKLLYNVAFAGFQFHTLRASVFHHSYPDVLTCESADKMKVRLRTRSRLANICPWLHDHSMKLRKGVCPGHHSFRHCHPSSPCHPSSCKVRRYMHDLVRNISWFAQRLSRCHPSPLASQPHPRCSQRKS